MKAKKAMVLMMASAMAVSMTACGSNDAGSTTAAADTTAAETTEAEENTAAAEEGETTEAAEEEASESGEVKEVVFPETINNGEEVTLSFAWWGAQTRHERTQQVVEMFMEKYPSKS